MESTGLSFLTPISLWEDFTLETNLQPNKVNEVRYDKITYSEYYFSGRQVEKGKRVRIFGVMATPDNMKNHGAILYVPNVSESLNFEMITEYAKMGYIVLAVDLCGKTDNPEINCTDYPEKVAYANYAMRGNHMDMVEGTAKETCWYEWVCASRYALSFLLSNKNIRHVGVVGLKEGANVAWTLCAIDSRIDCSVMLFGAGWSAYRGKFKYDEVSDIVLDEERRKFIAAVDAHAYAKWVTCPVLYQTSTNNDRFDFDRSFNTLSRLPIKTPCSYNCAPAFNEYLDTACKKNVELFFKKHLEGKNIKFPPPSKLAIKQEDKLFKIEVDCEDKEEVIGCNVYFNEGVVDPSLRNWNPCEPIDGEPFKFEYYLSGNTTKYFAFAVVKYKSGVTVTSVFTCKDALPTVNKRSSIIYSSKDGLEGITFYDKNATIDNSIYVDPKQFLTLVKGPNDITGAYSHCGLITYKFGEPGCEIDQNTIIKLDVFANEFCNLRLILMQKCPEEGIVEYVFSSEFKANKNLWQNLSVCVTEFKSADGRSIKDFDGLYALRIEGDGKYVVNNILLI